jgi:FkbM family methyltransferase
MRKGFRVPPQKSGQAKRSQAASPQSSLQQTAYAFRSQRKFPEAKPLLQQLYESDPSNIVYALDFGEACMETEDFSAAARIYAKIIEQDPKHVIALNNLGGALIRCGRIDDARSMLEYSLELDPQNLHARINLGGILQAAGDLKGNLDNALKAVAIDPTSALAFNNLGSAFSDMAMFNEAKHAFETALMLDSKQVDALINLGGIESRQGNPASAAEKYEQVVKLLPVEAKHRADAVKFYASFEYFKQGILEKGWDYYEGGFSPLVPAKGARSPNRKFSVPRWDGEPLNGKTLLVWREQGLGDELLFATCLHELAALSGQIIVECDVRLVETFTRSFPDYRIRAEAFLPQAGNISPNNDFDLHVPMGSLMKYFRRDINDFKRSGAYIKPDPVKVAKFQERLAPYKAERRLVGICWRSGKLDPVRNLGYTTLDEWAELFRTPGFKFVNLQYGECEAELRAAEEKYGIEILRWPDLNLKDQLEEVFALIASLDCVVSVQTAALVMAGAAGTPSFGLRAGGWTALGNQQSSPWFKTQRNTGIAGLAVELDSHFHELNFAKRIGKTQYESPNLVAVKIRDIKVLLLKENKTDLWWYAQKSVLEEQASPLYKLISDDGFSHFIDVGANYGYISLLVGKNSPKTKIQCIEPDVRLSRLIEENFIINGVPAPKIINAIAGDQSDIHSTFALNPHSSLDNRVTQGDWNQVPVETIRLDDRLFEISPDEWVFIKVDTQGYEPRVIGGMNEWLKARCNWIVKLEFSPWLIKSQGGDASNFLTNLVGNFQCAEFPARVPFKQTTLAQFFYSCLECGDVNSFIRYVESLGEKLTGQVDLVIRSKLDSHG